MIELKVGDKVIINPYVEDGAQSKCGCWYFHKESMLIPGVFTIDRIEDDFGDVHAAGFVVNGFMYDEDWLLPVPLFKLGDSVKVRDDLSSGQGLPYGISDHMELLAGQELMIKEIIEGNRKITMLGDDGYLYRTNDDGMWSWSSPMFDLTNYKFKTKNYESRLQKQEAPFRGDSREITGGICCRKRKPRVTIQPISYQKVLGRG